MLGYESAFGNSGKFLLVSLDLSPLENQNLTLGCSLLMGERRSPKTGLFDLAARGGAHVGDEQMYARLIFSG